MGDPNKIVDSLSFEWDSILDDNILMPWRQHSSEQSVSEWSILCVALPFDLMCVSVTFHLELLTISFTISNVIYGFSSDSHKLEQV